MAGVVLKTECSKMIHFVTHRAAVVPLVHVGTRAHQSFGDGRGADVVQAAHAGLAENLRADLREARVGILSVEIASEKVGGLRRNDLEQEALASVISHEPRVDARMGRHHTALVQRVGLDQVTHPQLDRHLGWR